MNVPVGFLVSPKLHDTLGRIVRSRKLDGFVHGYDPLQCVKGYCTQSFIGLGLLVGIWPAFPAHLFIQCVDRDIKEVNVCPHDPA